MRRLWLSACVVVAAAVWLAGPAEAQKGKGGGKGGGGRSGSVSRQGRGGGALQTRAKGGGNGGAKRSAERSGGFNPSTRNSDVVQERKGSGGGGNGDGKRTDSFSPSARNGDRVDDRNGNGNGGEKRSRTFSAPEQSDDGIVTPGTDRGAPARSFAHPKSGNALPQEVRDRLPPGLRDKPVEHPGLANHLRKMGYTVGPDGTLTPPIDPALPPVDPTLPPITTTPVDPLAATVRNQLPPGLRDRPYTHPGVANHLRKMGYRVGEDGRLIPPVDPTLPPPPVDPSLPVDPVPSDVRNQLPATLRDRPLSDPAVANYLGRMGWTIADDGTLITAPRYRPEVFPEFRPFGGYFRRR